MAISSRGASVRLDLGKLIGTRTWGGIIGISGPLALYGRYGYPCAFLHEL